MRLPFRNKIRSALLGGVFLSTALSDTLAQSDAWVLGNSWGDMNALTTTLATPDLPTGTGPNRYTGQSAVHSQVVRGDGSSGLLFFAVDGNIYDREGYLMADALGTGCTECLHPGEMEMLAIPVPGSCTLFYLLTSNAVNQSTPYGSKVQVSLLDLTAQNPYWPDRSGKVLDIYNDEVGNLYPNMDSWVANLEVALNSNGSTFPAWLPGTSQGKANAPMLRVIDPTGNGSRFLLYQILSDKIHPYEITSAGIFPLTTSWGSSIPIFEVDGDPFTYKSYNRDADVTTDANGDVILAMTDEALWDRGTTIPTGPYQLLILRFNAATGALLAIQGHVLDGSNGTPDFFRANTTIPPPNLTITGAKGCAFIANSSNVLLTGFRETATEWIPAVGAYDLNTSSWTDLVAQFNITQPLELVTSRLYRNRYPGTGEAAVFLPRGNGLAAFKGTDNIATMTFEPTVPISGPVQLPQYEPTVVAGATVEQTPYFLNAQITNDNFAATFAQEEEGICCLFRESLTGRPGLTLTASANWSPTNNPFGNLAEVTFYGDVVVPAGFNLIVSNMTLRFAPHTKLIIQRGGRANLFGTTLTSSPCNNLRWDGIRVEGNSANPYQDIVSGQPVAQLQGRITLNDNCVVENARYGIWCAREYETDTTDPDYFGGVARAFNTTFRNCLRGVQVENYRRFDANNPVVGPELANRCQFVNCIFETTSTWPSGTPGWMAYLESVRHIRFAQCRFENNAPQLFPPDLTGGGLFLLNTTTYVDGNNNPAQSYIKGFHMGVFNASGAFNSVRVSKMHFDNNVFGIADLQSSFVEYGENTFLVRDQGAAPNPRVGMLLWETKQFTIEQNTFAGEAGDQSVGIFCVGYTAPETEQEAAQEPAWSYTDERIYNNTFTDLQAGTLLTGLMRGHAWGNQDAGLQIFCGDYTDNRFDIAVLPRTMIRPNQGGEDQLAGNRFYNVADCSSNYDWALDVDWNQIPGIYPMELDYIRHEFPDDLVGVTCDQWTDFNDFFLTGIGEFDKVQDCDGGVYPIDALQRPTREASYLQAKDLLYAALATYNGTVDLGETPDLKQAIHQNNPWLSSSYLRDLLLAKHPLSDEVLVWLLKREVPMDPWHLTQVLLQNSRLNSGVWSYIKDNNLLSPFFYAMVEQAQQGTGITTKQLLEQEIVQRRLEMTEQMNVLGHIYARDTTDIPSDSLRNLMSHDPDHQFLQKKVELLLAEKRYAEAEALLNGAMAQHNGREVMADLLAMHQSTNGEWKELNQADKDVLYTHAEKGKAGAARAAAILLSIDESAPLPPVRFPNFTKSRSRDWGSSLATAEMEPAIACYPNPATTNSFVTYPSELDGTAMAIHDVKGALVHSLTLNGNGLVEINVQDLDVGLYNISVPGSSLSTKLNVQR